MASANRNTVFICYARKDSKFLTELHEHLAPYLRSADIAVWDDTRLRGGEEWRAEIQKALTSAQVAICLVTHSFRASMFIAQNELPPLLRAAKSEGLVILPMIVGACDFQATELAGVQAINDPRRPLRGLTPEKRNIEWVKVVRRVREVLHDGSTRSDSPPNTEGLTHWAMVNRLGGSLSPAELVAQAAHLNRRHSHNRALSLLEPLIKSERGDWLA
jgi:TIR domain